jgi:hypothetical protein
MEVTKEMLAGVVRLQNAALAAGCVKLSSKDVSAKDVANELAAGMPAEFLGKGLVVISPVWEVSSGDSHLGFYRNIEVRGDDAGNRARRIALQAGIRSPAKSGKRKDDGDIGV